MRFDYLEALRAGASPEGIAEFLSKENGYDLEGALKAGAPLMGVIEHLSKGRPLSDRLLQAGKEGIQNTITAGELAATYDPEKTAELVSEAYKRQTPANYIQRKMAEEAAPYQKAYEESSGFGAIGPFAQLAAKRVSQFAQNPEELAVSTVQNLPQSVPGIAGALGGAGTGGALGSVVPGVGTAAGAITGGVIGGTAGAYPIEQGSAMQDLILQEAQKQGIDPTDVEKLKPLVKEHYEDFLKQSRLKGVGTAATDAAINVATLGIASAPERALLKEVNALTKAKQAGTIGASDYAKQLAEIQAKQDARNTLAAKTMRGIGITGAEMGGEGLSEAAGQELAYGKIDPLSVIDESILGLGQGTGMSATRNILNRTVGQATNDNITEALNKARTLIPAEDQDQVEGITPDLRDLQALEHEDRLTELENAQKEQQRAQEEVIPEAPAAPEMVAQDEDIGTVAALNAPEPTIGLHNIPTKDGASKIVDYGDRKIVMADVNGTAVPFYLSTGLAGKKDVAAGKWYPILGVGEKGWINKGTQSDINSYYGSPELKAAAEKLDTELGDIRHESHPTITPYKQFQTADDQNAIDFINSPFTTTPAASHDDPTAADTVAANVQTIKDRLARPTQEPAAPKVKPAVDLVKSFGIGPTANVVKAVKDLDLNNPEHVAQINTELQNYVAKYPDKPATPKIQEYLASQEAQNATQPDTTAGHEGLAGSNEPVVEPTGTGRARDTGAPDVAVGPTVEPSGVPAGQANVGEGAKPAALEPVVHKDRPDYWKENPYNPTDVSSWQDTAGHINHDVDYTLPSGNKIVGVAAQLANGEIPLFVKTPQGDKSIGLLLNDRTKTLFWTGDDTKRRKTFGDNLFSKMQAYEGRKLDTPEQFIAVAESIANDIREATASNVQPKANVGEGAKPAALDQLTARKAELKAIADKSIEKEPLIEGERWPDRLSDAEASELDAINSAINKQAREAQKVEKKLTVDTDEINALNLHLPEAKGPDLSGSALDAVTKGNLQGAIGALAKAHPDKEIGNLLQRIKNIAGNTKVQTAAPTNGNAARYDAATDTIQLHPQKGMKEHAVIHEATHAALAKTLANPNHPITQEFDTFFREVQNQLGNEYGGTDLQEFAAEFLGNEHFQELLKNIQTPKKQSMFGAIVDAIARMLGFKKNTSAYDTAVKHLNNVLDITEGGNVAPIVQTTQGMGAAVSEGFRDLAEAVKHANKVPKNAKTTARDVISNAKNGGIQKTLMNMLSLNNMADMLTTRLGDVPASVREMSTIVGDGIKNLDNLLNQRASVLAQKTHASSEISRKMTKAYNADPKAFDRMSNLALEASNAEVDILSATPPVKASKVADYNKLRAQFVALEKSNPAAANSYRMMREAYKRDIDEYLALVKDLAGESVANQMRNDYVARGLEGYIPFMRYGDFVLEFEDPKTNERNVMQFESAAERQEFIAKELEPRGVSDYLTHKRIDDVTYDSRRAAPSVLVNNVMNMLSAKGASKEQLDAIYQLQLSLMPASSIAKRAMHRKGTAGMSTDLIRGFNNVQTQWDRRLTASVFDKQIRDQAESIRTTASRSPDTLIQSAAQSIVERTPFMLNPVHGKLTNFASAMSYHLYIAGNLSSAFVNVSSLPLMVWPKLGAQFGFDKASSAMNAVKGKAFGDWGTDPRYRSLYAAMVDRNQLVNSLDREILQGRDIATQDKTGIMSAVLRLTSIPFTESEKYNRSVTAMAAYDLARNKGMSDAAATEYAVRTVEDMHTSGTAANGSKLFQSDLGRVFFTFKSFAWNSAYVAGRAWALAARNAKNMQRGAGESEQDFAKRQAAMKEAITQSRRQLLGMYGMSFAFGGIKGLPFYGGLSALAAAMHSIAGDDDEPWDLEHELEQFFGTTATNGFVNEITNLQIGQRTSIVNDLLYRDNPRAVADFGYAGAAALSLLGPAGGYLASMENSFNMFQQGHYERAIEGVMPSSVRNIMKGMRYASEGAVTLKGDTVDKDISAYSALMQIVGFAPADLSTIQDRKAMAKAYEKGITERRSSLLAKYNMAREADDQEILDEVRADIDKFNDAVPEYRITGKTLHSSVAHRRANQQKMLHGMMFNQKLRGRIQDEFFSDIDEEEEEE